MKLKLWTEGAYRALTKNYRQLTGEHQDLNLYFNPDFADALEIWANDTAWPEIEFLLRGRSGRVLDLACGTGRASDFLKQNDKLEYNGVDISSLLIERAIKRGIPEERLFLGNAAKLPFDGDAFDYVFSIGSLEHFALDVLSDTLLECRRVCKGVNFHQLPVSRTNLNEGWFTPHQAYWNNSRQWWISQFEEAFGRNVYTMDSHWSDPWSIGVWFICISR